MEVSNSQNTKEGLGAKALSLAGQGLEGLIVTVMVAPLVLVYGAAYLGSLAAMAAGGVFTAWGVFSLAAGWTGGMEAVLGFGTTIGLMVAGGVGWKATQWGANAVISFLERASKQEGAQAKAAPGVDPQISAQLAAIAGMSSGTKMAAFKAASSKAASPSEVVVSAAAPNVKRDLAAR